MRLRYLIFLALLRFCESVVPSILANETIIGGAGVRGRLSQKGVNYLARILTNILMPEVAIVDLDLEDTYIHLPAEKVSIASIRLIFQNVPPKIVISTLHTPNIVSVRISEIGVTGKSELSVHGVPTTVIAEITTPIVSVNLNVSIERSPIGAPQISLRDCELANATVIKASVDGGSPSFQDEGLKRQIKESLETQGGQVLNRLICGRIKYILDERINRRFDALPTKLTLAKVHENVILADLAQRIRAAKHSKQQQQPRTDRETLNRARRAALLSSFNVGRANSLFLDYTLVSDPWVSPLGLELESGGEVSIKGRGGTPFGPVKIPFPEVVNEEYMLQMAVSDYMTNSLLYHGHEVGLFNTRVDPQTPHFGPIMRTSCRFDSRLMFCLGDLFPTMRKMHPDHQLALFFDTVQAPVIRFMPPSSGGITFALLGKIVFLLINPQDQSESKVAEMEIDVKAHMKLRLSNTDVRPKITLDSIKLTTLSPAILLQAELDQAVMLTREVLQRMVNDILSDGIPIPLHPLFKLNKPKIKILERALLLQTNFELNEGLLKELVTGDILERNFSDVSNGTAPVDVRMQAVETPNAVPATAAALAA